MNFSALTACALVLGVSAAASARAERCADIAALKIPHVKILHAEIVASGTFALPEGQPLTGLPAICRVSAAIDPTGDSDIRVELWMPVEGWNHRLEDTGNGGLAGHISYGALSGGVRQGYAIANTDMGMATPPRRDAAAFIGHPARWADWGYRATHEMSLLTKQLVKAYYGEAARHTYFVGCSTGGQQALMEAQRFPDDYEGIVAGAPANDRTNLHIEILWNFVAAEKNPGAWLPSAKITLLQNAVVNACDTLDGVKDGILNDPRACHFDPAVLVCSTGDQASCLTPAQVKMARQVYGGARDPRTGASLYPGLPRGSEFGWGGLGPAPAAGLKAPYAPLFEWVFGAQWDWRTFDFDHDVAKVNNKLAATLNADSPNLDTFRAHGHKLLIYHGWADWLVPPAETIRYVNQVADRDKSVKQPKPLDASLRLFMVPGMSHCGGGPGVNSFDPVTPLVKWVEDGAAPETITATRVLHTAEGAPQKLSRPLCPYPAEAVYNGSGEPDALASWACKVKSPRQAWMP